MLLLIVNNLWYTISSNMIISHRKIEETPHLQREIAELEKKLEEKKKALIEKGEAEKHEKELIKEIIKEKVETPPSPKITPVAPSVSQKVVAKTVKELKGEERGRQIQLLINLVLEKGVIHATEVAKKLDSPYILDEFHDTLVDELYNYLVKQGKLKQV